MERHLRVALRQEARTFASGNSGRALNAVVGGWQVAFIGSWQSGNWMGVTGSEYLFGNPALDSSQRLKMNIFGKNQQLYFRGDFDPTGHKCRYVETDRNSFPPTARSVCCGL